MKLLPVAAMLLAGAMTSVAYAQGNFQTQMLVAHNVERQSVRAMHMVWDARLAADADAYARELARAGRWGHSAPRMREEEGENLWAGTRSAFGLAEMVAAWSSEKRMFRAGVFPNVSRSGSWHDVGHYTQMVWPTTTRIGCGLSSSDNWDYLVCRYSSPGNVLGYRLGSAQLAGR